MARAYDLTGQTFGQLVVKERAGSNKHGKAMWLCQCECGGMALPTTGNLTSGNTKACNHCREAGHQTHGLTNSYEYRAWCFMKATHKSLPKEWERFETFIEDIGMRPSDECRLARYDKRQPHNKENTYWRNANEEIRERKQLGVPMDIAI